MAGTWKLLDHTADFAIEARGRDLPELIQAAAEGMMAVLADTEGLQPEQWHEISAAAEDEARLVHHVLRELLYLFEDGLLPVAVADLRVEQSAEGPKCSLRAGTVPLSQALDRIQTEIKAVTYHNLEIRREDGELVMEIVFDV